MAVIDGGEESTEVLSEILKATAIFLINQFVPLEDVFIAKNELAPTPLQIKTLYIRAYQFADHTSEPSLRISAIRLLAALFTIDPPARLLSETQLGLERFNVPSLYKLVTTLSATVENNIEYIFVTVGALDALTRHGEITHGITGIISWLMKALSVVTESWMRWCGSREEGHSDTMDRRVGDELWFG